MHTVTTNAGVLTKIKNSPYVQAFASYRMIIMVVLGFASGLPLPLTSGTLQAWLTTAGIDIKMIGIFSIVGLPYTLKFFWSPFMDRFVPPFLGRRRGWIVCTQVFLLAGIAAMALTSPAKMPLALGTIALCVAFFSASQDIVVDAYRTDVLPATERGTGVAVFIFGYRIAFLVAGALALMMADRIGWQKTYLFMACLMIPGMLGSLAGHEPDGKIVPPRSMREAVWGPLKDFFSRRSAIIILLFIILYKLGDAYAGALTTAFLIRGVHFTLSELAIINKLIGIVATIVGALFGGALMVKMGLFRSLWWFGILQTVSNLSFMVLAIIGKSYTAAVVAVAFENITGGMGSTAFVAFVMALCNKRFTATQFALLSSLAVLGRVVISPTSGYIVTYVGWAVFFLFTVIAALPGLALLLYLKKEIVLLDKNAS
ncbi:MAG: MFS transporter [Syntrophorhabdaceae bacterium]|nr:MFS transporter [Syntrophorhabdaceae bacterium]MDD4194816.1 MFS transporter [Syntrophorhabdaceae bacterium]